MQKRVKRYRSDIQTFKSQEQTDNEIGKTKKTAQPLIIGEPGFQRIIHDLNFNNDVISSVFNCKFYLYICLTV